MRAQHLPNRLIVLHCVQPAEAGRKRGGERAGGRFAAGVCALSGERFETFWDDAREQWRFRDAVRLDAAQAARVCAFVWPPLKPFIGSRCMCFASCSFCVHPPDRNCPNAVQQMV